MAQSIKLGSDTYLDASGVEVNASNSALRRTLSDWIDGIYGFIKRDVSNGASTTFSIVNSGRVFILCDGVAQTGKNIIIAAANSSGSISYTKMLADSSNNLEVTTATNALTITNNTSAGVIIVALAIHNVIS